MKSRANESRAELVPAMPSAAGIGRHASSPKRRANLLYKLRRKGIEADTKQRVIFIPYGEEPRQYVQAVRLCREFYFSIQFIIT